MSGAKKGKSRGGGVSGDDAVRVGRLLRVAMRTQYTIRMLWTGTTWDAEVLELPGCRAQGETPAEAARSVGSAMEDILKDYEIDEATMEKVFRILSSARARGGRT